MSAWWLGLQPAQAEVECGGARHRLRWEAGELTALDHTDLEGERALAGLGGEPCVCLEVLDAWERHAGDERVLVAAGRGPADRLARREWNAPDDDEDQVGWVAYGPSLGSPAPPPEGPYGRLPALLSLPGGLADRLTATVAASCAGGAISPRLHAALYGRVAAALADWLGRPELELELTIGDAPSLARDDAGVVHAELPFAWLVEVWARDLTTVMDRFCLSASTDDGRAWELLTVSPDFGTPELLRLGP